MSNNWEEHLQHPHQIFTLLPSHHLVLNQSKYSMGTLEVAYLGHVISAVGVMIAAPLNNLHKKNAFTWSETVAHSFQLLKEALSSTPVLQLPAFDESFVVEWYALGRGIALVALSFGVPISNSHRSLQPQVSA
ncbi:uncharacterized protein [Aristolochia californica]|uniref:uncharacterized protein n=1 Tax=Aristolochia californica TaxID=171875 RepID=UPI0035DD78A5